MSDVTTLSVEARNTLRAEIMGKTQIIQNLIPPTVTYQTQGTVLIIGPEDLARLAAGQLKQNQCVILAKGAITNEDEQYLEQAILAAPDVDVYYSELSAIKGFLGQFQVQVLNEQTNTPVALSMAALRKPHFDMVLDLCDSPCLPLEMFPAGYFAVGQDQQKLADALAQIPELVGEFEKPRYVKVNNDVCAHYRANIPGCQRCLNVCPADAIQSVNQQIEIDPYLCHGAGSCTNACPTGALTYDAPSPLSLHDYLAKLVRRYREQAGVAPVVAFYEAGQEALFDLDSLAADVLPVALEEIAVAGIDHWFAAIAYGARQVVIYSHDATPPTLMQFMQTEVALAQSIFSELKQPNRIELIQDIAALSTDESATWVELPVAEFKASSKRDTFYAAVDFINSHSAQIKQALPLANIPYGLVQIDADKCTLCLSCVSSCPSKALRDGGNKPALCFREQDCVQCGLCQSACPEKAIKINGQINFDQAARQQVITLKEEKPFDCICCGKPFASTSMVEKILAMVGTHSAFSANIERLKMCEDCRVKDLFQDILKDPESQLRH